VRTLYLGSSDFAVMVLRALAASEHRPALVLTRPDRPRGRGQRLAPGPVAVAARELGLECVQPERPEAPQALEAIEAAGVEAACVCAYGAILREPLLSARRLYNVHPSLLPRWRGAAPIERAIMAGDRETGVCIMRPVAELDAGPVALSRAEPIAAQDTYGTLGGRLAKAGAQLLIDVLDGDPELREQDPSGATYAEKISAQDRWLEPLRPAIELDRTVRALSPHVGARLRLADGGVLGVRAARLLEARAPEAPAAAGELTEVDDRLVLGCGQGALELCEVQPSGGRPMPVAAYLRGHR